MHTILGAGGAVANALTRELINADQTIRLVSRKPSVIQGKNISWQKADLLNNNEVLEAAKGSTVIYLTAGIVYDKDIWKQQWPLIMQNAMNAAKANNARLIFFDNIYMYGLVNGPITEDTPYNPISSKGEVRVKIAETLMREVEAGNLQASIARGADFYGTENMNAFFDMMLLDKFAKKQRAQWIGDTSKLHNFSFIPDMGKAVFLLGQTPKSDNQIWHMPTAAPLTGKEFIKIAADIYKVDAKYFPIKKFMLQMLGWFDPLIKDMVEMYYQYDHDYNFNSDKFEKAFKFEPTSYHDGITTMAATRYKPA